MEVGETPWILFGIPVYAPFLILIHPRMSMKITFRIARKLVWHLKCRLCSQRRKALGSSRQNMQDETCIVCHWDFLFFPVGTWTQQLQCLCPWSWISRLFSTKDRKRAGRPLCACCASQIPASVCVVLCTSFCRTVPQLLLLLNPLPVGHASSMSREWKHIDI